MPTNQDLATRFAAELRAAAEESRTLGHNPTRFLQMLDRSGAVALAKRLVLNGELQDGIKNMVKLDRADLAMEAIMLRDEYRQLFTPAELEAADWRLKRALVEADQP